VRGNEFLFESRERVAFERGPIVYCFEHEGDANTLKKLTVSDKATATAVFDQKLFGGLTKLEVNGVELPANAGSAPTEQSLVAIPYFAWDNSGLKPMTVWVRSVPPAPDRFAGN
jgi:uncharacterized protein